MFLHAINLSHTNSHTVNEKVTEDNKERNVDSLSHLPVFPQACPIKLCGCPACHRWWVWANPSQLAQEQHARRAILTPSQGLKFRSQVRKWNGANVAANVLAIATCLLKTLNLATRPRQSVQRVGHFVRAAPPKLFDKLSLCACTDKASLVRNLVSMSAGVFPSPDFFNLQFFVLNRVLNPQVLHLDMSGFASESSPVRDPESGSSVAVNHCTQLDPEIPSDTF